MRRLSQRTLILAGAVLLAACAAGPSGESRDGPAYAGCWIERHDNGWSTLRWAMVQGAWRGDWARNSAGDETETAAFEISNASDGGDQICGPANGEQRCFPLTQGGYAPPASASDENRAYLDAGETNITFAVVRDGRQEFVFRGERDACD